MAEVAGLAIASVGLIALFDTAVKGIRCIMLASDFESDLKPYLVSLRNAELRVCRWGDTVGLAADDLGEEEALKNFDSARERNGAKETLHEITTLTDKVKEKSKNLNEDPTWLDSETQELCHAMEQATIKHPRCASLKKKCHQLTYVLFQKDRFQGEIQHICRLSHELMEYPGNTKKLDDVAKEEVQAIGDTKARKIVEIVGQNNEKTDEELQKALSSVNRPGHVYNSNITGPQLRRLADNAC